MKNIIIIIILGMLLILFCECNIHIPCIFNLITNLYCPGCGITRMFLALFKFEIYQAFRYNQLMFIMLPFVVLIVIDKYFFNKIYKNIPNITWYVILIITLVFGVIRNIFPYFAPTIV